MYPIKFPDRLNNVMSYNLRMTYVVYSSDYLLHDNSQHPENASRLLAIMEYLKKVPFFDQLKFIKPEKAREEDIEKVHTKDMIKRARQIGWIDMDTYTTPCSYEVAKLAIGGAVTACNAIINRSETSFALIRPPGHHATRTTSMGFCLFNNVAIAAHLLTECGNRVLIFDHDVHHGNGTQDIFYNRDDVLYQSIHVYPHYPGTGNIVDIGENEGMGYTINAPLPHGAGDDCVTEILNEIMIPIARQFKPDIILISAGFDSHHTDQLGGLRLSLNMYGKMIDMYKTVQKKIACCLEGGYNLIYLPKGVAIEMSHLCDMPISFNDKIEGFGCTDVAEKLRVVMKEYWDI